jgi:predicted transcriptional regulator
MCYNKVKLDKETSLLLLFSKGAETRKRILRTLLDAQKNCNQIRKELRIDWWSVQKHLRRLQNAGLVEDVSLGRILYYKMTSKGENVLRFLSSETV